MKTSTPAHLRARIGLSVLMGLWVLVPGTTIGESRDAVAPTPAQQALIEIHQHVGAAWWSPTPSAANTPAVPTHWSAPVDRRVAPRRLTI